MFWLWQLSSVSSELRAIAMQRHATERSAGSHAGSNLSDQSTLPTPTPRKSSAFDVPESAAGIVELRNEVRQLHAKIDEVRNMCLLALCSYVPPRLYGRLFAELSVSISAAQMYAMMRDLVGNRGARPSCAMCHACADGSA